MTAQSFSLNYSIKNIDNEYHADLNYTDSEGNEIKQQACGEDFQKVNEDLIYSAIDELMYLQEQEDEIEEDIESDEEVDEYVAKLENIIYDLRKEIASLKLDNDILQRRADDAVKESMNTKKYNDGSYSSQKNFSKRNLKEEDILDSLLRFYFI